MSIDPPEYESANHRRLCSRYNSLREQHFGYSKDYEAPALDEGQARHALLELKREIKQSKRLI
jgi:hypothetical protein